MAIMENIHDMIVSFIEQEYKLPENVDFDTFDYVRNGYVDSLRIIKFVALIEDEYDIEFTSDELHSDKFRTIAGLENIIKAKIKGI